MEPADRNTRFAPKVYPRTGRQKVAMPFAADNSCKINAPYLPVWRQQGLFFKDSDRKYCGTFYYYEPDSDYFLNLGSCLVAGSKIDAILQLEQRESFKEKNGDLALSDARIAILSFIDHFYPGRLPKLWQAEVLNVRRGAEPREDFEAALTRLFSTREGKRILADVEQLSRLSTADELVENQVTLPRYGANGVKEEVTIDALYNVTTKRGSQYLGGPFVKINQDLDQLVCNLAREQGYDTVLLQREPGPVEVNTEIIDTRDREDSYRNICLHLVTFAEEETVFPRIWTPELGFLEYRNRP